MLKVHENLEEKNALSKEGYARYQICEIDYYPIHQHSSMEVIYVISGSVNLRYTYYDYLLSEGCLHVINGADLHSISAVDGENRVFLLNLDLEGYKKRHNQEGKIVCVSGHYCCRYKQKIKSILCLTELLRFLRIPCPAARDLDRKIQLSDLLIEQLLLDFQSFSVDDKLYIGSNRFKGDQTKTQLINRVIKYMYDNHKYRIRLTDIAEREHLSVWRLSHLFKEAIGCSFQDYVGFVRAESSERLLLGTSMSIANIAACCGFSSPKYYIEHFSNWFGMTPAEYRDCYKKQIISTADKAVKIFTGREEWELLERMLKQLADGGEEKTTWENPAENFLSIAIPPSSEGFPSPPFRQTTDSLVQKNCDKKTAPSAHHDSNSAGAGFIRYVIDGRLGDIGGFFAAEPPGEAPFYGGSGMTTSDGFRKASYYAAQFLKELGPQLLLFQNGCLLTKKNNFLQILLYHSPDDPLKDSCKRFFIASNHPADSFSVIRQTIDQNTKMAYPLWKALGSPSSLTQTQKKLLKLARPDVDSFILDRSGILISLYPGDLQFWHLELFPPASHKTSGPAAAPPRPPAKAPPR